MTGTKPATPPTGLLFSQIGYDAGDPVRVVVRGPAGLMNDETLHCGDLTAPLRHWGEIWGSHWWVADLGRDLPPGTYDLRAGELRESGLRVGEKLLHESTWRWSAIDQLERRAHLAYDKPAWQDAGAQWQECYSHSLAGLGLLDLIEVRGGDMTADWHRRAVAQARVAVDYMARLQDVAAQDGRPAGAVAHDPQKYRDKLLIGNAAKAAALLARAGNVLPADDSLRNDWRRRARLAADYALDAEPHGEFGFIRHQHGVPEDWPVPKEHRTSDLLAVLWAYVELGDRNAAAKLAGDILVRQVPADRAESGISGHFYTFASSDLTERSWSHAIGGVFGSDGGQALPHYVAPLISMCQRWPDHADVPRWRAALERFAADFLLPACRLNPFGVLPLGHVAGEGWLHFAGPWHGFNAAYGWTATLALQLRDFLDLPELRQVAVDNLQWVAGLNAGHTREALAASLFAVQDESELPPGVAKSYGMVHGVGGRSLGGWTNARGSVSNGFCVGEQFKFDVPATAANDGPFSYADEDWIPHALAFVAGACRL